MNEIRNQFNGIANDFRQVKKKQKFHEMLIMVTISLLLISLLCATFFQKSSAPKKTDNEIQLQQQLNDKDDIIETKQKEIDKLNRQLQAKDITTTRQENPPQSNIKVKPTVTDNPNNMPDKVKKVTNTHATTEEEKKKSSNISKPISKPDSLNAGIKPKKSIVIVKAEAEKKKDSINKEN